MEITIEDLRRIIASSVDVGVQNYIKTKEPENDRMKQSEAQRYIQKLGYQPVMLTKWVHEDMLRPIKTGKSRNSPVVYSLAEIKELIFSLQAHRIFFG